MAYKIKSELSEKQIESDVATYLGWCTPNSTTPFRLFDVNEQITGADKKFDRVFPLYLQFKVSEGLQPLNGKILNPISRNNPLNLIRSFRYKNSLNDNPTLYFKFRKLAKTAIELQHNTLLKFANTGFSQAMYIAPLSLSKEEYERKLFDGNIRYLRYPFIDKDYQIYLSSWISNIFQVPFLREHISIIPHQRINTPDHYYSYSNTGTEVAFHSPLILEEEDNRLSTRLSKIVNDLLYNIKQDYHSFENIIRGIDGILETNHIQDYNNENGLEILKQIGEEIYKRYNIRQNLLLFDSKMLDINGL